MATGAVNGIATLERQIPDLRFGIELRRAPARQILFEHLKILAVERLQMMIAADQRRRLEDVNQRVSLRDAPVAIRLVPHPVKPDAADVAVAGRHLTKLAVHEFQILRHLASFSSSAVAER